MAEETITSSTTEAWTGSDPTRATAGAHMLLEPGMKFEGDPFTVGGLVELRSGGPPMTVSIVGDEAVHVEWFYQGELQFADFHRQMLQGLSPDPLAEARSAWRSEWNQAHLKAELEQAERHAKDFAMTKALIVGFAGGFLTAALFGWIR